MNLFDIAIRIMERGKQSIEWRTRNLRHKNINKKRELNEADWNFLKQNYPETFYERVRERDRRLCKMISAEQVVLTGPFKGMKFPNMNIDEHTLVPKILGSYESELHQIFNEVSNTSYNEIINIGCAEGYYAVGLARNIPDATVFAYDTNEHSLEVCRQMARTNHVDDRIELRGFCSAETLARFPFRGRTLILCDCEGYERELFDDSAVPHLSTCDLLIEMHDCIYPGITSAILTRFALTHHLKVVSTRDKPTLTYPELGVLNDAERKIALCDNRGSVGEVIFMEWAWLKAKANN